MTPYGGKRYINRCYQHQLYTVYVECLESPWTVLALFVECRTCQRAHRWSLRERQ